MILSLFFLDSKMFHRSVLKLSLRHAVLKLFIYKKLTMIFLPVVITMFIMTTPPTINRTYSPRLHIYQNFTNFESTPTNDSLSDVYHLDGSTELEQLTRAWQLMLNLSDAKELSTEELAKKFPRSEISAELIELKQKMGYSVSAPTYREHSMDGIQRTIILAEFWINETTAGSSKRPSRGGTSFTITTRGCDVISGVGSYHTESECSYKDHFNGSYTCWCAIVDPVTDVEIYALHTHFSAFNHEQGTRNKVFKKRLYYSNSIKRHNSVMDERLCASSEYQDQWLYPVRYWIHRKADSTPTYLENDCPLIFMSNDEIQKCYKTKFRSNIHVLGDSHLAYTFFYLISLVDKEAAARHADKVHNDMTIKSYHYYWATFQDTFQENLDKFIYNVRQHNGTSVQNEPHFLLMDAGTWDISHYGPIGMVQNFTNRVIEPLKKLTSLIESEKLNVTLVWQTMPSYPFDVPARGNWWRNVHVVGAINKYTCGHLAALGIPCLDAWPITLSWQNRAVCGNHMICAREGEITGHSGMAVAHKLLRQVC